MEEIKRVQNRLFEMAKVIDEILTRNNIPYMIAYGTLLGAVRHEGFIPWDDDFDIFLFEDNKNSYENAINILKKELPRDLFLEYFDTEPHFFHGWARIRDLKTEVDYSTYPQDNIYSHRGLTLDLFKAEKIKEVNLEEYRTKENIEYLGRIKKQKLITEEEYNKRISEIEAIRKEENEKENDTEIYGVIGLTKKMYNKEIFPLRKYKFDNYKFYGPNDYNSILARSYGNYMELPPVEKRKAHYSYVEFI